MLLLGSGFAIADAAEVSHSYSHVGDGEGKGERGKRTGFCVASDFLLFLTYQYPQWCSNSTYAFCFAYTAQNNGRLWFKYEFQKAM